MKKQNKDKLKLDKECLQKYFHHVDGRPNYFRGLK